MSENNPWATTEAPAEPAPANPWSTTEAPADNSANPWGAAGQAGAGNDAGSANGGSHWLQNDNPVAEAGNSLSDPFAQPWFPIEEGVEQFIAWFVPLFRPFFTAIKTPIDATLTAIEATLSAVHPLLFIVLVGLLAWQMAGRRLGIATAISFTVLGAIGVWQESMITLSLVLTSVFFCTLIGIPTGIWMARSETANHLVRPVLDAMQTTPAFVYLVPIVMLFGIGNVPGVVVTIIFAVPPVIRLTNLGIRQVPANLIEAAHSFGASRSQLLFKVQLPLAMPTIMAGVNQTLMLALSMVVIASMIAVGGLGLMVMRGIGRLDIGLATLGGIGIVILAIILDRMTQSLGRDARERGTRNWYDSGPAALFVRLFAGKDKNSSQAKG
ncbi:glycine betaine/L-proline ABC transporter permease ProW [Motiliproteus sediminis]|uniref:glycine betaine/L-proline ABC transporter permease ProW n=1 Tax=Motiliproteus sediminis TaxID=1468178 RepID=UPI001AEF6136|nr:glycine betaine/L-proline ABC transporter permease ProW [Motiliproteus sediminis]